MILSGAALAQVGRSGDGKDVPYANLVPANQTAGNTAAATSPTHNETTGNDHAAAASDQKTEPATPRR